MRRWLLVLTVCAGLLVSLESSSPARGRWFRREGRLERVINKGRAGLQELNATLDRLEELERRAAAKKKEREQELANLDKRVEKARELLLLTQALLEAKEALDARESQKGTK